MQAALRFIGTNLRGFSLSRTHGLTPWHRRRLNISAILWFFVPQSDGKGGLPLHPLPQRGVTLARCGAAVYPVRRCGAGAACPCTLYRKGGSPLPGVGRRCTLCGGVERGRLALAPSTAKGGHRPAAALAKGKRKAGAYAPAVVRCLFSFRRSFPATYPG